MRVYGGIYHKTSACTNDKCECGIANTTFFNIPVERRRIRLKNI